jgi:hypothetical protein
MMAKLGIEVKKVTPQYEAIPLTVCAFVLRCLPFAWYGHNNTIRNKAQSRNWCFLLRVRKNITAPTAEENS